MQGENNNKRLTIGIFVTNRLSDVQASEVWAGAARAAQDLDINLFCFPTRSLQRNWFEQPDPFDILLDLAGSENIDGLVSFNWWHDKESFEHFYKHFHPLPVVNILRLFKGYPGVAWDNHDVVKTLVNHLVTVHGYSKIAYLNFEHGNKTVLERHKGYVDALAEHGIALDDQLVVPIEEGGADGSHRIRFLMDERGLRPGQDFEAVIAFNDEDAFLAIEELQARDVHVPNEVAVVGINNVTDARVSTPPLTTVAMPRIEMGRRAVEMLVARLRGEQIPEEVLLSPKLMVRRSCGCQTRPVRTAGAQPITVEDNNTAWREEMLALLITAAGDTAPTNEPEWAEQLVYCIESQNQTESFLLMWDSLLSNTVKAGKNVNRWQDVLSVMHHYLWPTFNNVVMETLWQQARVMVSDVIEQAEQRRQLVETRQNQQLRDISQALITTFDPAELMDMLATELPRLNIPGCFLALYEKPNQPTAYARLRLAYHKEHRINLGATGRRFPSRQLIPAEMLPIDHAASLVVEPLYFRQEQIGIALFEAGPSQGGVYEILRGQISSALRGGTLIKAVSDRTQQFEVVARLSERLTAILDFETLLGELVEQVKSSFNYYHAHVYILDDETQNLVMAAGAGEVGAQMKTEGHSIRYKAPTSLVAQAARSGEIVIVANVRENPDWLPNPLLPDTYAEMAVPIILEDEVVGVLDVQATEVGQFDQDDAAVLQTLANQVSVAIRNARLFAQAEQAVAKLRGLQQRYTEQAWGQVSQEKARNYQYDRPGLSPLAEEIVQKSKQLARQENGPTLVNLSETELEKKSLVAPVTLSGATIGSMQLHLAQEQEETYSWTDDDMAMLEAILDQVAQTAENLRLFEETRQRAGREQATREIAEKMQAATDLEGLIKIAADELGQYFSLEYAAVELGIEKDAE